MSEGVERVVNGVRAPFRGAKGDIGDISRVRNRNGLERALLAADKNVAAAGMDRGELIRLMVGRDVSAVFPKQPVAPGPPVLEVRNLSSAAAGIRDVTLTIRRGEILGLAGLVERGLTETEIRQMLGENIARRLAGIH